MMNIIGYNFAEEINSQLSVLGNIENFGGITKALKFFQTNQINVNVDIYISKNIEYTKSNIFWKLYNNSLLKKEKFNFRLIKEDELNIKTFHNHLAPLAIVLADENLIQSEVGIQEIKKHAPHYDTIFILSGLNTEVSFTHFINSVLCNKVLFSLDELEKKNDLIDIVQQNVDDLKYQKLFKLSYLSTLQPLFPIIKNAIQNEFQIINSKKDITAQLNLALRKQELSANINEQVYARKALVNTWSAEMEKYLKTKYEDLLKPRTGAFINFVSEKTNSLNKIERVTVAEKTEKQHTVIEEEFQQKFRIDIENKVKLEFTEDCKYLNNSLSNLRYKLDNQLDNLDISINQIFLPEQDSTINSYIDYSKTYSGELSKKGVMEYFIALREYSGTMMVIVGLLAPITMITSSLTFFENNSIKTKMPEGEVANLSFFQKIIEYLKEFRNGIGLITGSIMLILIVYGYFDLRKRIPAKRIEEYEREFGKAKELLNTEGKRMIADATRDWQNRLIQWLREINTQLQLAVDNTAKNQNAINLQKINDTRQNIQMLNQSAEIASKNISNFERSLDNINKNFSDTLNQLKTSLK